MKFSICYLGAVLAPIVAPIVAASPFWNKVGADIDGEASNDNFGKSVAISADGTRVAIGASSNAGHTQVFEQNNGAWTQLGGDIDGEAAGDQSGYSVSLSEDGTRVAVGAPYNDGNGTNAGHTRVFEWSNKLWNQVGGDIDGEAGSDWSGYSVSLSEDGTRVAVGAPINDGNGTNAGHTRVFELKSISSSWTQLGGDIDGEAIYDISGCSVSLSADGTRVAIGASFGNSNRAGRTRVFELKSISSSWIQVGDDIDGEAAYDESGSSVSLSADGTRVAVGAPYGNSNSAGRTRVFELKSISSSWTQLGGDIDGKADGDNSGNSVSLSADGIRVAVVDSAGRTQIYQWSNTEWTQLGGDIDSDNNLSVSSVSLSADGTWVAVGAVVKKSGKGSSKRELTLAAAKDAGRFVKKSTKSTSMRNRVRTLAAAKDAGRTQVYMLTAPSAECLVKNGKFADGNCEYIDNKKQCIGEVLCKWNKQTQVCAHVCSNRKNKKMCHTQRFNGENMCKYTPTTDAPDM